MNLVKESYYNIEYKLSSSSTADVRVVAGSIEKAIEIFKIEWPNYEIKKVNFVGYFYRLPYKTITINI